MLAVLSLSLASLATAHIAAWNPAMYCFNGNISGTVNLNTNNAVNPLFNLKKSDYWFHHVDTCDEFPPATGQFLELPAGGSFTVELGDNRASTSYSGSGMAPSTWPDGLSHPTNYTMPDGGCIVQPNLHTQNQSMAAGTAFAIAYTSSLAQVTPENLVVFTVRYNTPWQRLTTYDVPAAMPACPADGCICAWSWVPNGCGEPNMYMEGFKCRVTSATSTTPLGTPKPPVWCEGNQAMCVTGPKQMIIWNQAEGNNINVTGFDMTGLPKSPAYNAKCGFKDGAQDDIFATGSTTFKRMVHKKKQRGLIAF